MCAYHHFSNSSEITDSDRHSAVRIYGCPSLDDYDFTAGGTAERLEHVNTEHAEEYQREDWPATDVAQKERHLDEDDSAESADE
ncbi:hypothetical protein CP556_24135 [Natrinema sp. CBA1119]|uniref:hypothetical protein n=1 Tax=Natrinema sp. CBA1119 TaxID=1608465 RepID=UPI000BF4AD0F|nr:hypothetical protein [Natrinema sp. CBA1119]PGF14131.1 hypothetical protein CP556_24135 [Natrinema sp. CBA1119]